MELKEIKIGFVLTGSFCTFKKVIPKIKELVKLEADVIPIMSYNSYTLDTKFGKAKDFTEKIEKISGKKVLSSLTDVEPIGPKNLTDVMLVCPCTGTPLGKICMASTDTPVTLAVTSHLRVQKPVIIALASNDALGASAVNFGRALNTKYLYLKLNLKRLKIIIQN